MRKRFILFVCFVSCLQQVCRADGFFSREPSFEIRCNMGNVRHGYSRMPRLHSEATFWCTIDSDPEAKDEWKLSGPFFYWSILPSPNGGRLIPLLNGQARLILTWPESFGVSYDVSVAVCWDLTHKKTGEVVVERRSASYRMDAVLYSFQMRRLIGARASGELWDSYPARVHVAVEGCSYPDLLNLSFSAEPKPEEDGTPINKAGTEMSFVQKSPLLFEVESTYWYGLKKPGCCYGNRYPYEVTLREEMDGIVVKNEVVVGWPDEHPEVEVKVDFPPCQLSIVQEGDRFRAIVSFQPFRREAIPFNAEDITDQYREETIKEEQFHIAQFTNGVSWEDGAEPDIYSSEKVRECVLKKLGGENDLIYSEDNETQEMFSQRIQKAVDDALRMERRISERVLEENKWYREKKAKENAGYNAAWTYHCTYEDEEHPEESVSHKTRQEIEEMMKEESVPKEEK